MSGLCFCARAFSSCGKRGPLIIAVRGPLHHRDLSCCGAQATDAQAQQPWLTGPVAPRHVGSSQTRARTRAPCISRQTLNHCATREAPHIVVLICISLMISDGSILSCVCWQYVYLLWRNVYLGGEGVEKRKPSCTVGGNVN